LGQSAFVIANRFSALPSSGVGLCSGAADPAIFDSDGYEVGARIELDPATLAARVPENEQSTYRLSFD
jgi:hypothetical protein